MDSTAPASSPGLVINGLWKSYDTNTVLQGIDLTFSFGEVHALLGANGAGKSTLLGCLSGAVHPDAADISIDNDHYDGFTPRRAFDAGIAIIYQHFQLIGPLTVAENVFLGRELRGTAGAIDRRRQNEEAAAVLAELGIVLDPTEPVERLSVGAQQMVEIARAVRLEPRVLILDEPTAALGRHEVAALLSLVRRLARRGIAVIYVTHLLGEVLEVADRATVLRDGRIWWTRKRGEFGLTDLVEAISPEASSASGRRSLDVARQSSVAELRGFCGNVAGPVDLDIRGGEIVGLFGLLGSGRTDLLEGLAGVRPVVEGTVLIDGTEVYSTSPSAAQKVGIVLVPSDRKEQSLFGTMTTLENMLMPHFTKLARGRWIPRRRRGRESEVFERMGGVVGLIPPDPAIAVDGLSGGNAQKVAVARWTCGIGAARLLLMDEPTQGVDIGARRDLYELMRTWSAEADAAVLFASSDPEEILMLADRVVVLAAGGIVHSGPADMSESDLIALAQPTVGEVGVAS